MVEFRMKNIFKGYGRDYILLTSLLLFHTIANYIWLRKDTVPLAWDQTTHLILSLKYLNVLTSGLDIQKIIGISNLYPPFFHISTSPFYLLFGTSSDVACMSILAFLGILIFSVYGIGKHMYNRNTGLLSAFLVSMYPMIFGPSREYLIDVPLVAMVSLSVYLLLRTEEFKNTKCSLLFGLSLGLGMLTKWSFIFFIIGPFLYEISKSLTSKNLMERKETINIILAITLGILVASIWYFPNIIQLCIQLSYYSSYQGSIEGDPAIFSLNSILYYPFMLIYHTFLPFVLLFLVGLAYLIPPNENRKRILILWIALPYLIFTLILNKDLRYTIPYLPAVAIISSFWIFRMKNKIRNAIIVLILIIASIQFVMITNDQTLIHSNNTVKILFYPFEFPWEGSIFMHTPMEQDWKIEDILYYMNEDGYQRVVGVVPGTPRFNPQNFEYYKLRENLSLRIEYLSDHKRIAEYDFIVTKSGLQGLSAHDPLLREKNKIIDILENQSEDINATFKLVKDYELPDGSIARIYERKTLS